MSLRMLDGEERDGLMRALADRYGFDETMGDLDILEGEGGLWAVSHEVIKLPLRKLRTDSIGILLARRSAGGLTPTIAALQLFARPIGDSIALTIEEASAFIERRPIRIDAPEGRHVVFHGGRALDLGRVRDGVLLRVKTKP